MKKDERIIQFFDLQLYGRTRARDIRHNLASPRSLDQLMHDFWALREANKARKKVDARSKLEFRLEHMEELDDAWMLLVNVVDTEAAHPVTNKVGGTDSDREVIELGDDRGLESSSHILIYKSADAAAKHVTLIERNPSLPFSKALAFLNHLSRVAAKHFSDDYRQPHPSGVSNKTINTYCVLSIYGHPSDEFRDEVESGVLTDIRLTSDANIVRGYDSQRHAELIGTEVRMKVGRIDVALSGGNWGHIQKALRHANDLESPYVRIQFTGETGSSHTATLSTDTGLLYQADKYIKKRKINSLGNNLKTAFPVIHEGIKQKMLELLE